MPQLTGLAQADTCGTTAQRCSHRSEREDCEHHLGLRVFGECLKQMATEKKSYPVVRTGCSSGSSMLKSVSIPDDYHLIGRDAFALTTTYASSAMHQIAFAVQLCNDEVGFTPYRPSMQYEYHE